MPFRHFTAEFVRHFGKDIAPEDTELSSVGRCGCEKGEEDTTGGTNRTTERAVTVMTAHDHMELGKDMLCSMADALFRIARHGRATLPSMWWA
jgi:hypothetical protein